MGVSVIERLAILAPFQTIGQIEACLRDMPRSIWIEPVKDADALLSFLIHEACPQPTLAVIFPVVEPECLIGMWSACKAFDAAIRSEVCQLAVDAQNDLPCGALCQQAHIAGNVDDFINPGDRIIAMEQPAHYVDPQQPVAPLAPDRTFSNNRVSSECNPEDESGAPDRGSCARTAIWRHALATAAGVSA